MLIDTHAHLTDPKVKENFDIDNIKASELSRIICISYDMPSSIEVAELADCKADIFGCVGVHPSDGKQIDDSALSQLAKLCDSKKIVGVGEIGLDYYYDDTDRACQQNAFRMQLELASFLKLPITVHMRDATNDTLNILKEFNSRLSGGIMHCFSATKETALTLVDMGFYISFSGAITFKNNIKALDTISALPLDKILVETDCPYLTPVPFRGKPNIPTYVKYVAEKVAEIKGITVDEVAKITSDNAYKVFPRLY